MDALIERAGMPVIVVHTTTGTSDIEGVTNLRDLGPVNIHRWWNVGIAEAERQGADVAVVANHDVIPDDEHQLNILASATVDAGATLGVPGDETKMRGYCFALNLTHTLRPTERFTWYWGDDWLWDQAELNHRGRIITGAHVTHDKPSDTFANYPREFRPYVRADKLTWRTYLRDRNKGLELTREPTVSVVIPWRDGGCEYRRRNVAEAQRHLEGLGWQVILADSDHEDFNRAAARNRGVERATGEVIVIHDADMLIPHNLLTQAAKRALSTGKMQHPYHKVRYLTEAGTRAALEGRPVTRRDYLHDSAGAPGGCAILPRKSWQPYDERFTGWGHEDIEWATRIRKAIGQQWGTETVHHMWHPPAAKDERTQANHDLLYATDEAPLPEGTVDVVYRVRAGESNEELRYSLRSLVNLPHRYVWIVGDRPSWVKNVRYIPGNVHSTKWKNVWDNIRLACEHPDITDPFVMVDDDMFVMSPLDEMPTLHRGTLASHIGDTEASGSWRESLDHTLNWCRDNGIEDPLSYEIHVPYVVHKAQMLEAMAKANDGAWPLQARSIDGNYWNRGGAMVPDPKVRSTNRIEPASSFLSSDDRTFGRIANQLRAAFPKPSRYETPQVGTGNAALDALRASKRQKGTVTQRARAGVA